MIQIACNGISTENFPFNLERAGFISIKTHPRRPATCRWVTGIHVVCGRLDGNLVRMSTVSEIGYCCCLFRTLGLMCHQLNLKEFSTIFLQDHRIFLNKCNNPTSLKATSIDHRCRNKPINWTNPKNTEGENDIGEEETTRYPLNQLGTTSMHDSRPCLSVKCS